MANKIMEVKAKNEEVATCLDSNPEWEQYCQDDLNKINEIENKPLVSDPRSKDGLNNNDEELDFFFRLKSFGNPKSRSSFSSENDNDDGQDDDDDK